MKFNISVKNIEISGDFKQKVNEKVTTVMGKYVTDPAVWVEVVLTDKTGPKKTGRDKRSTITVKLPGKQSIEIIEDHDSIEGAFELSKDRLEKALSKWKEKKSGSHRRLSREGVQNLINRVLRRNK